ncbi:MAG: hypothetical protein ACXWV4_07635 [Flavitalea sp.]
MNKDLTIDHLKLIFVGLICLALMIAPCIVLNIFINKGETKLGIIFGFLPIISVTGAILRSGNFKDIIGKLTYVKYRKQFPLYYYYDEEPKYFRWPDSRSVESRIESGDVILRRHDEYLDGLILLQNSYYSHVGIAEKDENTGQVSVHHALGKSGVTKHSFEKFAKCDDIAVLRFNGGNGLGEYLKKTSNSVFYKENKESKDLEAKPRYSEVYIPGIEKRNRKTFEMKNVRPLLYHTEDNFMHQGEMAEKLELSLFDRLTREINEGNFNPPKPDEYIPLMMSLANQSEGIPYDFDFNFQNFKKMSCVEFVWFCYKSLFPIHQVKRRVFTFFGFIRTFVMVPDLFLGSKAFDLIYCSMSDVENNKYKLLHKIRFQHLKFWNFFMILIGIQVVLFLVTFYVINKIG